LERVKPAQSIPDSGFREFARSAFYRYIYECFEERYCTPKDIAGNKQGGWKIGSSVFLEFSSKRSCEKTFRHPFDSSLAFFRILPGFITTHISILYISTNNYYRQHRSYQFKFI